MAVRYTHLHSSDAGQISDAVSSIVGQVRVGPPSDLEPLDLLFQGVGIPNFFIGRSVTTTGLRTDFVSQASFWMCSIPRRGDLILDTEGDPIRCSAKDILFTNFARVRSVRLMPGRSHIMVGISPGAVEQRFEQLLGRAFRLNSNTHVRIDMESGAGIALLNLAILLGDAIRYTPEHDVTDLKFRRYRDAFLDALLL